MDDAKKKLLGILNSYDTLISYSPIDDEPNPGDLLIEQGISATGLSVLPEKHLSPIETARALNALHKDKRVAVFIPGRVFDHSGTRHGRGGGWYDQLLARIPESWIRIGVLYPAHVSEEALIRKSWDEPVDFLIIKDGEWKVVETGARS